MPNASIIYNDYEFNELTSYEVTERFDYDEAETTVVGTTFQIRAKTFIAAEPESPGNVHTDSSFYAGPVIHPIRQKLSKPGKQLIFKHDGFGPSPSYIDINNPSAGSTLKDISGGPKPRVMQWIPVGNTASAEMVWECETTIPVCDGVTPPRVSGVKAFNYSIQYDIDASGYTTRRIAGYIEITMTRKNREIPDSVDDYRGYVQFQKPQNFSREISWNVSADKRRADFMIVDTEKRTSNPFPPNVIDIQVKHRVGMSTRNIARASNTLSAQITLSPLVPRVTAWFIYYAIAQARLSHAAVTGAYSLSESLEVEEDVYGNQFSFVLRYTTIDTTGSSNIVRLMGLSGLFQPLGFDWPTWDNSVKILGPFQNLEQDYGLAALKHVHEDDRIVDLCDDGNPRYHTGVSNYLFNTPTATTPFRNVCPVESRSWVHFEAHFEYHEEVKGSAAVTLGPNQLAYSDFNPSAPADFDPSVEDQIERWIETYAGSIKIYWKGGAERVCHEIKPPGKITVGDLVLVPAGKIVFESKLVGWLFGLPLYRAFWIVPYKLKRRPTKVVGADAQKLTTKDEEEA